MYLVDTDVISEARKGDKSNHGVRAFFEHARAEATELYLSVATVGELRHGVERIRCRGDMPQARRLDRWLRQITTVYEDRILALDAEVAHVWGGIRAPNAKNLLDEQVAATALMHGLVVVTRNVRHFAPTDVRVLNPFG